MPKNYRELLTLEKRFEQYLQTMELKKEELAPYRIMELRRAFMAGFSSALVLFNQDLNGLDDLEGINCMAHVFLQVDSYWKTESVNPYPSLSLD